MIELVHVKILAVLGMCFPYAIQFHKIFVIHKNEFSFSVTKNNFVKSEYEKTRQYTGSNFTPILISPPFLFSPSAPEALRSSSVLEARYLYFSFIFSLKT